MIPPATFGRLLEHHEQRDHRERCDHQQLKVFEAMIAPPRISASSAASSVRSGIQNCATAGFSNTRSGVTCWTISAWLACVFCVSRLLTTEMPTLEPMLRDRL